MMSGLFYGFVYRIGVSRSYEQKESYESKIADRV